MMPPKLSIYLLAVLLSACATPPPAPVPKASGPLVFPGAPDETRLFFERTIYGSADVVAESADGGFRRLVTGEQRTGEGLAKPYAIAVWQGRMFVSDSADRYVRVFDVAAGKHYRIGEDDPGRLQKPLGLDVDASGTLYVADATLKVIMVYDKMGAFKMKIGGPAWFDRLSSVTVDRGGARIYVTDIGGVSSENHRVRVFDAKSGQHLHDIGKRGTGPGELNLPRDVAIGKDGLLYVVDGGNFRVQVFQPDGTFVRMFGSLGKQFGQFARPKEIAADRLGNLYVVDAAFSNFQIFSPEGNLLMFVGTRSERDGPAKYMLPSGIYVDEDDRVYLVDQWFRKVDIYRPPTVAAGQGWLSRQVPTGKSP